jgi:hypothetical protein
MGKCFYTAKVILLGLVTAQVIATIHVHLSNAELFHTLVSIRNAGYLVVPNQRVMPSLLKLSPAFYGGLFFTLSAGAGLSLLTLAAAWIWDRLFFRKKILLLLFLIPWIALIFHTHYCLCTRFKMDAGPAREKGLAKQNGSDYSDHSAGIFVDISNGQRPVFEHKRQLASFQ